MYKTIMRPVWFYEIVVWGSAKPSNIRSIQAIQAIALRLLTRVPSYVSNVILHNALKLKTVTELAKLIYKRFIEI